MAQDYSDSFHYYFHLFILKFVFPIRCSDFRRRYLSPAVIWSSQVDPIAMPVREQAGHVPSWAEVGKLLYLPKSVYVLSSKSGVSIEDYSISTV